MSTDLATTGSSTAVSLIQQTALELSAAHKIATAICDTSFVPKHFNGKAGECAVAILYGSTIGLDPVTAIQQIFVIGGKPALYARTMVAIVLSKGHEIWTEEESPGSVTVAGKRKGSDRIERVTWTSALAQQAGYTSNSKYKTDPRSMLYARASGDVARRIAPDALMGMGYNVEELEIGEVTATVVVDEPSQRSGLGRLRAAIAPTPESAPIDVSDAEEVTDATVEPEPAEPTLTQAQSRNLYRLLKVHELDEKETALTYLGNVIGHDIASTKDLTKDEAAKAITALESIPAPVVEETPAEQTGAEWFARIQSGEPA